jgi:hypothetical protein
VPNVRQLKKCDVFFLDLRKTISWDELPNRGVFAVDECLPAWMSRRLFTVRSVGELRDTLERFASEGMLPDPGQVYVLTAAREEDLPDQAREEILHSALSAIEALKTRGDIEALREVRRALDRRGKKPGVPRAQNNRWLIELLFKLAESPGKSFKELVPEPWKPASASARLSKFCWDFYQDCVLLRAETPETWTDPRSAELLNEWYGFRFGDAKLHTHDLSAAREAYRRGKQQVPETSWPDGQTGSLRHL